MISEVQTYMKITRFPSAHNKNQDHSLYSGKFMNKVCGLDVYKDSAFACILDEKKQKVITKDIPQT